jgi:hypothetical protein
MSAILEEIIAARGKDMSKLSIERVRLSALKVWEKKNGPYTSKALRNECNEKKCKLPRQNGSSRCPKHKA